MRVSEGLGFRVWGLGKLVLGGSWDLVSRVISTLVGVISLPSS